MVDRFTITAAEQDPWIDADPSGQWVRYSDYAALEAELAEARKALERIEVRTRSVPSDTAEDDKRDKYHANSIARRALEAQGGE